MKSKKILSATLFLYFGITLSSVSVFAETAEEIRGDIQSQINQRHPNVNPSFWQNFGPEALPVIKQMYKESNDAYAKGWLIEGVGYFDSPDAVAFLKSEVGNTDNEVLKKMALSSLIRSQGEGAYDFVEPYLKDSDAHIRLAVAQGLRDRIDTERARKRLELFAQNEKEAWVKSELKKKKEPSDVMVIKKITEDDDHPAPIKAVPTPMPEKTWAGEWKGAYITPAKNSAGVLNLTLVNEKPKKDEAKWKIELKLPKKSKQIISEKDAEIVYYQTAQTHWLEIRVKKDDSVYIGQRKAKP